VLRGVITIPLDPVFHLGPIPVHWYGVGYAVAFLVGIRITRGYAEEHGIPDKDRLDIVWWNIAVGLVAARLFFVLQQPNLSAYLRDPVQIVAVWQGGMAFFGALIGCLATTVVLARRRRLPVWALMDTGAIFATLPQAIGRLGNIVNGDILGPASNLPWATRYTNPHTFAPIPGVAYQPAGAYELLGSLALFAMVMLIIRARAPEGLTGIAYLAGYAISQFLLFFLRDTEPVILFGLKQAQVTALVMLVVVVPALVLLRRRHPDAWTGAKVEPHPELESAEA
jgi:phosphatidylglycerol:prolipoprotein diacylglycerol transferase